jgi:glycosyltransferase involved in cell wall biosynthesis
MSNIAILHYAGPPGIGGVESTIAYHARGLTQLGYSVRVVSGSGAAFAEGVDAYINPLFGSTDPRVLATKAQLDKGHVSPAFATLVDELAAALRSALADCSVCIAHNIPTLHKNLALTAALARLNAEGAIRVIAWCNDLAWTNPQYAPELHPGFPWDLLRCPWPNVSYVTISEPRRTELAALFNIAPGRIAVIVPGIDPARFWDWSAQMRALEDHFHFFDIRPSRSSPTIIRCQSCTSWPMRCFFRVWRRASAFRFWKRD